MNAKGFTLVETLIALVIVAVSLSALIKANQQNAQQIIYFKQKTLANVKPLAFIGFSIDYARLIIFGQCDGCWCYKSIGQYLDGINIGAYSN
jgi:prepilin-type N-terminal cleavage/methylation domain-containing protein